MATRVETDSFGPIEVPAERLWGAQTERSRAHFSISTEKMPEELILALVQVKRAACKVNLERGALAADKGRAILAAADEILRGAHAAEFPLSVWQTGSGTQSNMNVNEVLANRASELLGGARGQARLVHPNDDVNLAQSSNDVVPSALNVAAALGIERGLLPALAALHATLDEKARAFADIVKIGRTHLQDATPLTLGQEISGWVAQLEHARAHLGAALAARLRAGDRRHRRRHRAQRARRLRRGGGRRAAPGPRASLRQRAEQVRGARRAGRDRARARRAEVAGLRDDEDRQRRALAGLGAARRHRRDHASPRTSPAPRSCRAR